MRDNQTFKLVCDACGSLTIKVANPEGAPEATIVECGRCHSPRGNAGSPSRSRQAGTQRPVRVLNCRATMHRKIKAIVARLRDRKRLYAESQR
jgi:hypothetical protein